MAKAVVHRHLCVGADVEFELPLISKGWLLDRLGRRRTDYFVQVTGMATVNWNVAKIYFRDCYKI